LRSRTPRESAAGQIAPARQYTLCRDLVQILILEIELRLEAIADEPELVLEILLRQILRAGARDVHLNRDGHEEREHPCGIVIDQGRQVIDLVHVFGTRAAADPDHELIDQPGDRGVAVLLRMTGNAIEPLPRIDPQIIGQDRIGTVIAPVLERGGQSQALVRDLPGAGAGRTRRT